jgi:Predicted Zn-dependent proteases and their inactivated homologs
MISKVEKGVYITEIEGLGTGMNPHSGDFSCQAEGFMIRDGKIAEPLNLITLSGNLFKMLADIKSFDNKMKLHPSSFACTDVLIKKMAIGGK